ncbi:sarcosine oxidase subunit delta [Mesorhizobium sp. CGMCC 1.15528]|uniref:Sarcosine oxidase subunit delta n=1 Tax=Mesorhizobium zhangyense TaxID=1776730 RepID=A0A7C9V4S6_9HYPH|nr:sarcosine oxidase subunit delta [Mesorhizobium zhangyense]NGN40404.1 sarcosine oxidase subunit delta [Mesorhizobium zhangyense]
MQLFPCPFCGPRSESEFHFGGDFGNLRPEGSDVSASEWSAYLHLRANPKGSSSEVWMHMTCGELFRMDRNTVDNTVNSSAELEDTHR